MSTNVLHFKRVRYRNFMAVGNEWMDIQLDRSHMTLVTGHNGAGKTTIEEALFYGLFGKALRKLNIGQLINIFNKGGLEVEVTFVKGGVEYRVLRGEKPKKFEIYKDKELIESTATVREYQKVLDQILGIDRKMFAQMVVLEKNEFTPFMALQASERRKVVEDVLNISIYSVMNKIAGERLKQCKQTLDNYDLDTRLKQKDIDSLKSVIESLQQNTDALVAEKQAQKAAYAAQANEKKAEIKSYAEQARPLVEALAAFGLDNLNEKQRKFNTFDIELKHSIKVEQDKIKFFTTNTTCPTCNQRMEKDHVQSVVEQAESVIKDVSSKIEELERRRTANSDKIDEALAVEKQLTEVKRKGQDLTREYEMIQRQIQSIEQDIIRIQQNADVSDKIEKLAELENEMKTLLSSRAEVATRYDALRDIQIALKDDGAKAFVIKEYMPVINSKLNEFLEYMNFNIAFELDEKFEESFANPARAGFVYHNLSNGQKSRVDFAILLSWLQIAELKATVSTNIMIIDEMLESLDPEGIEMLMHLFRDRFKDKNIFVISQRQNELASHFRNEIAFKLENGYTVIDKGNKQ